jgi:hypothetical protein
VILLLWGVGGDFAGTYFQQVDSAGGKVGEAFSSDDIYVAGDMVTMEDGRICWPYVRMAWDLSQAIDDTSSAGSVKKLSFACMGLEGNAGGNESTAASKTTSEAAGITVSETASAPAKAASSESTGDDTQIQIVTSTLSEATSEPTSGTVGLLPGGTENNDSSDTVMELPSNTSSSIPGCYSERHIGWDCGCNWERDRDGHPEQHFDWNLQ